MENNQKNGRDSQMASNNFQRGQDIKLINEGGCFVEDAKAYKQGKVKNIEELPGLKREELLKAKQSNEVHIEQQPKPTSQKKLKPMFNPNP